jgi:hypothetical protein
MHRSSLSGSRGEGGAGGRRAQGVTAGAAGGVRECGDGAGGVPGGTNGGAAIFGGERAPGAEDGEGVVFLQQDEELSDDVWRAEGGRSGRGG